MHPHFQGYIFQLREGTIVLREHIKCFKDFYFAINCIYIF